MKKVKFLLAFLLQFILINGVFSQDWSKFYITYEYSNQTHYNTIGVQSPYVAHTTHYPTEWAGTHIVNLGYKINSKFALELGYYNKLYLAWVDFKFPKNYFFTGTGSSIDIAQSFPIRFNYTPIRKNVFKRPLNLTVGVGITVIKSDYYFGYPLGIIGLGRLYNVEDSTDFVDVDIIERHKIENGISPFYFLLEGRLQGEYEFSKYFSIFANIGYKKGFKPMGYARGTYQFSNSTTVHAIENITYGNHLYKNIGIKINPFLKSKKLKK